jgi:hypothetical protein
LGFCENQSWIAFGAFASLAAFAGSDFTSAKCRLPAWARLPAAVMTNGARAARAICLTRMDLENMIWLR